MTQKTSRNFILTPPPFVYSLPQYACQGQTRFNDYLSDSIIFKIPKSINIIYRGRLNQFELMNSNFHRNVSVRCHSSIRMKKSTMMNKCSVLDLSSSFSCKMSMKIPNILGKRWFPHPRGKVLEKKWQKLKILEDFCRNFGIFLEISAISNSFWRFGYLRMFWEFRDLFW